MWYFVNIHFRNLFSHVDSEYRFENNTTTVIFGENQSDKGFENNGSGKSTLLEAISIAYSGSSLRDLNKEDFINYDYDWCDISLELKNDVLNKHLLIYRKFDRNDKSIVKLTENNVVNKKLVSVNEANKRIVELIGLTREDLLRYYIFAQDSRYNFFSANDGDKKEITNRITSANLINPVFEELSKRFKNVNANLNEINNDIISIQSKIDTLQEQIDNYEINDETKKEIESLKEELSDLEDEYESFEKKQNEIEEKFDSLNESILSISKKLSKHDKLKNSLKKKNSYLNELNSLKEIYDNLINDSIICPKCGEHFVLGNNNITLEEAEENIKEVNDLILSSEKEIEVLKEKLTKYKDLENDLDDLNIKKNNYNKQLRFIKNDMLFNIEVRKKKINKIKRLQEKGENDQISDLKNKVVEFKEKLEKRNEDYSVFDSELIMIKYWQYYMGKSGFTTFLANKSVKLIEGITNSFLLKFKTDISIIINGFKVLKDGSVREKVEVFIQNNGLQAKRFMSNSGGERGRVIIAGILGVQSLINNSLNGRGLNFIGLDESFPGIDPKGQENMIKILEKVNVTILVITQNVNSDFNVKNSLKVIKTNEVSKYVGQ